MTWMLCFLYVVFIRMKLQNRTFERSIFVLYSVCIYHTCFARNIHAIYFQYVQFNFFQEIQLYIILDGPYLKVKCKYYFNVNTILMYIIVFQLHVLNMNFCVSFMLDFVLKVLVCFQIMWHSVVSIVNLLIERITCWIFW